jgi:K+-sensing histidine kinase KdpD
VALCVRAQLDGVSGGRPMFLLFMLPITLAALLGGLLPGLWATVVSGLLTSLLAPDLSLRDSWLSPFDRLQWGLMLTNGVVVSLLSASLLRSLQHQ